MQPDQIATYKSGDAQDFQYKNTVFTSNFTRNIYRKRLCSQLRTVLLTWKPPKTSCLSGYVASFPVGNYLFKVNIKEV